MALDGVRIRGQRLQVGGTKLAQRASLPANTRAETDIEDLNSVAIFCGAGLLLSLVAAMAFGFAPRSCGLRAHLMQALPPASHVPPAGFLHLSAFVERSTLRFDLLHFLVVLRLRLVQGYLRLSFLATCTPLRS